MLTMCGIAILAGAALSRFKYPILFPAFGLAIVSIVSAGIASGDHIGSVILTIALVVAALQIGFLLGMALSALPLGSHRTRKPVAIEDFGLR